MTYKHRFIEQHLNECLQVFSVVGITGPRQSGKSTLLINILPDYKYLTFDDFETVQLFKTDPYKFFRIYNNKVIFDEVQKVPTIFNYIKIAVDNDRNTAGKFVVTGSSDFSVIKGLSESLAGRIALLSLLPYQCFEMPENYRASAVITGSYPELVNKKFKLAKTWYSSYIETYINRDVAAIANIGNLHNFRKLLQLLAANISQTLNATRLAKEIGVDVKTIKRWINIMEASYIIYQLKPFYNNLSKRIVKSPKIYFIDNGLATYLTGIENLTQLEKGPLAGPLFENYVIIEILKKQRHKATHNQLYYFRDSNGLEIDLIVDKKQYLDLIEIKASETFNHRMLSTIEKFIKSGDQGYLLYNGMQKTYLDNFHILNYQQYLHQED